MGKKNIECNMIRLWREQATLIKDLIFNTMVKRPTSEITQALSNNSHDLGINLGVIYGGKNGCMYTQLIDIYLANIQILLTQTIGIEDITAIQAKIQNSTQNISHFLWEMNCEIDLDTLNSLFNNYTQQITCEIGYAVKFDFNAVKLLYKRSLKSANAIAVYISDVSL